jgi:hypothetical protein
MYLKSSVFFLIFLSFSIQKVKALDPHLDDITQRKTDCDRYRTAIKDFEETLQQNMATKEFYSGGWLTPISYIRYFVGFDEKLKQSNMEALQGIHFLRDLLRQDYCNQIEQHEE